MKVCVQGLWHLGSVTAACLAAEGFAVTGIDENKDVVVRLSQGRAPLFEPGLDDLVARGISAGRLTFASEPAAVAEADVLWVAFDTPVDDEDRADVEFVKTRIRRALRYLKPGAIVLVSSQMPVGSIAELERDGAAGREGRGPSFACSPENLRLGRAIDAFRHPERIVVGVRDERTKRVLEPLLARFSERLLWVSVESAEMVKHALNAFLALSVTFTNEIATICEKVGADTYEVEAALRSEPRVGAKAYVRPGAAFAGGTLARDVSFLLELATAHGVDVPVLEGVLPSNREHRAWPLRRALEALGDRASGARAALLGLAYKPGTDALRRSVAVEVARGLLEKGVRVRAFDPAVKCLPAELSGATLCASVEEALDGADVAIVATDWPEFGEIDVDAVLGRMAGAVIVDQNRTLAPGFRSDRRVRYLTLGQAA